MIGRYPSKKVWEIADRYFMSDPGTANGLQKAREFAHANLLNENDIVKFDSEAESKRHRFLRKLEKEGRIAAISVHQSFTIMNDFTNAAGKRFGELVYEADFVYRDSEGKVHVEDVKGAATDDFRIKRRLFDARYKDLGLHLDVIRLRPRGEWERAEDWEDADVPRRKRTTAKVREENRRLRGIIRDGERKRRKSERELASYRRLKGKERRTRREEERMATLEEELKADGRIA